MRLAGVCKLFGLGVALALVALAAGDSTQIGLAQGSATVTVCATGCNFATIQAAIDAASGGTTIQVQAGTYLENLTIRNKDGLTLKGAGADQVTLDGNGPQQQQNITPGILILNSRNITVTGLKITNSRRGLEADDTILLFIESNNFDKNLGVGILLTRSQAEIKGNLVQETQFDQGGTVSEGIQIASSQATLSDNVVKENSDCGVRASSSVAEQISTATGSGNTITGNRGGDLCGNLPLTLLAQPPAEGTLDQVAVPTDAATIQEAVNKVKAGGTIMVAAGTYKEQVQIYKSVTIQGAGSDQTVLQAPGPEWTVLNIATDQLQVVIEGLKVTGGRRGLHIGTGPMGNVTLRSSKVESNGNGDLKGEGLRIVGQGAVTLDQVSVSENGDDGLVVVGLAKVTVQDSTIAKNARVGIDTGQFISITAEKNTIADNGSAGISLRESSNATIDGNTITRNVEEGIYVGESAQAQITNNQITATKVNTQANCCGYGVYLTTNAQATLQGNTISQNTSYGVVLAESAQASSIQKNTISNNGDRGVALFGSSKATLDDNTISSNVRAGINLFDSAQASINNARVTGTKSDASGKNGIGIVLQGNSKATIQNSTIQQNARFGVYLSDNAQATLQKNTISNNSAIGIYALGSSHATIEDNAITMNTERGILVDASAEATITKNRITNTKPNAQGNFGEGLTVSTNSKATLRDNTISNNTSHGVTLYVNAQVTLADNSITNNGGWGIILGTGSAANETVKAEISNNTIQSNKGCGIFTDSDSGIKITGQTNTISGNTKGQLCGTTSKFPEGFGGGK